MSRGLNRSIFVFFYKILLSRLKKVDLLEVARGALLPRGAPLPRRAPLPRGATLPRGAPLPLGHTCHWGIPLAEPFKSIWTNRAEAHGQLVLSPLRLSEQLRSCR